MSQKRLNQQGCTTGAVPGNFFLGAGAVQHGLIYWVRDDNFYAGLNLSFI